MAMPGHFLPQRIRKVLCGAKSQKLSRLRMAWTIAVCALLSVPLAAATLARAHFITVTLPSPVAWSYLSKQFRWSRHESIGLKVFLKCPRVLVQLLLRLRFNLQFLQHPHSTWSQ
jgi:hypothetical protein